MDFDLVVIGAGSGGVRAARMSAQLGARVAIIERSDLGGTCVNLGCVPKKLFTYAAQAHKSMSESAGFGVTSDNVQFDWPTLRDHKNREIQRLNGIYKDLLERSGCTLIRGDATLLGPHQVQVNDQILEAKRILIATGGKPNLPAVTGHEHVISSDQVFHLEQWPRQVTIVGGGYIAVEFAGIFNGLGVNTTIVHRNKWLLSGFDDDIRQFAQAQIAATGVRILNQTELDGVESKSDGLNITLSDGQTEHTDLVLCATGRVPNLPPLGSAAASLALDDRGAICVDDQFATSLPSVYAIGDVIGRVQLTPVALAEGEYLAQQWFGHAMTAVDYSSIATAVFSDPNIATIGLTESEAMAQHSDIDVFEANFKPMRNTLSGSPQRAYMKVIVARATDRVLGLHMVGPEAGEILQGLAVAYRMGLTKADLDHTIGIHPTTAEEFVTLRQPRSA
jgi:glutathione reductase (NADPH)